MESMQTEDSLGLTKKNLYNIKNKIPQGRNFCLLKYIYIFILVGQKHPKDLEEI